MVSGSGGPGRIALPTILLVDPDENARAMLRDALLEGARPSVLRAVADSDELTDYLQRPPDAITARPALILVDLDQAPTAVELAKRTDPRIPVIGLTSRPADDLVAAAYAAGANTVLPRPVTFLALVRLIKLFTAYWLDAALLPPEAA